MNSLYLENSIIGSLFRFFSPYFSTATRPTHFLLAQLVIAQLVLQSFPSLPFLHRNFLSQVTHRCLNSYYRALRNETVTSQSLRLRTAELACNLIPAALQNEPVFPSVDDTTVPKFGMKERTKLELSGNLIEEVRPLLKYQNPSPQELRSHIS